MYISWKQITRDIITNLELQAISRNSKLRNYPTVAVFLNKYEITSISLQLEGTSPCIVTYERAKLIFQ